MKETKWPNLVESKMFEKSKYLQHVQSLAVQLFVLLP